MAEALGVHTVVAWVAAESNRRDSAAAVPVAAPPAAGAATQSASRGIAVDHVDEGANASQSRGRAIIAEMGTEC